MYGTIARMRIKPGSLANIQAWSKDINAIAISGHIATYIYQMDSDANELYLVVVFESREAYVRNAESPDQNERFQQMMGFLEAEPEWHDGEIIDIYQA